MIIKSSTTLRNDYNTISNLAHQTEEPIYITKNGEGDLIVMSINAYEKEKAMEKLYAELEMAEKSRYKGTFTIDEARRHLKELYENG